MVDHLKGAKILITGGLGFIGGHFARRLLTSDVLHVTIYDSRQRGLPDSLVNLEKDLRLTIVRDDLLNQETLTQHIQGKDFIIHLGANTNMRIGQENPNQDIESGFRATLNVLEAMRHTGVRNLLFSSSSAVYGPLAASAVSENQGPLLPISTYGAAKLTAEAWISSYCHLFELHARIFRFGNVIGNGMDHGLIYDVVEKLSDDPKEISILGDGTQGRSYILVDDCIEAILFVLNHSNLGKECNVFNISGTGVVTTIEVVKIVAEKLGLHDVEIKHHGMERGWSGDVPIVELALDKISALGWTPKPSKLAVLQAAQDLIRNKLNES